MNGQYDSWNSGDPYEYFMGRWSRLMAIEFLRWLDVPKDMSWLDVGCGTGALSNAINTKSFPANLSCLDSSAEFLEKAKANLSGHGEYLVANATKIPKESQTYDVVVSGLALNFFPDLKQSLLEMKRVLRRNGIAGAYVWDYSDRMDFLRIFWDAAKLIDPSSHQLDEGVRFPVCTPANLRAAYEQAGFHEIETTYLTIDTVFSDFEDYWNPFLGGQGPAPGYLSSLNKELQTQLKETIFRKLEINPGTPIKLVARAIAVRGVCRE